MVVANCQDRHISIRWVIVEFFCSSSSSFQTVQDNSVRPVSACCWQMHRFWTFTEFEGTSCREITMKAMVYPQSGGEWSAHWVHVLSQGGLPIAWRTAIPSMAITFLGDTGAAPFAASFGCQSTPPLFCSSSSIPICLLLSVVGRSSPLAVNKARGMDVNSCWPMRPFRLISGFDQWMNQAYGRLLTTHGHITDCNLDSVVYESVVWWFFNEDLSCLGRTIYARQFLGAKPPIQFRHRWAERNHSDHLYWLRAAQSDA